MSLLAQIKSDQLQARKARDTMTSGILATLMSDAIAQARSRTNREPTDVEIVRKAKELVTTAKDNISKVEAHIGNVAERAEKIERINREIAILESYVPRPLSEAELLDIVRKIKGTIEITGPKAIGAIMQVLNRDFSGAFDNKLAGDLIRKELGL